MTSAEREQEKEGVIQDHFLAAGSEAIEERGKIRMNGERERREEEEEERIIKRETIRDKIQSPNTMLWMLEERK